MGFVYDPDTYKLKFAEPSMEGLEVRVRTLTMGELKELGKYAGGDFKLTFGNIAEFDKLLQFLVDNIISWNLEKAPGETMSISLDTLMGLDPGFVSKIIVAWMDVVSGIPIPLPNASASGPNTEAAAEASLPMEPLSTNPSS